MEIRSSFALHSSATRKPSQVQSAVRSGLSEELSAIFGRMDEKDEAKDDALAGPVVSPWLATEGPPTSVIRSMLAIRTDLSHIRQGEDGAWRRDAAQHVFA